MADIGSETGSETGSESLLPIHVESKVGQEADTLIVPRSSDGENSQPSSDLLQPTQVGTYNLNTFKLNATESHKFSATGRLPAIIQVFLVSVYKSNSCA